MTLNAGAASLSPSVAMAVPEPLGHDPGPLVLDFVPGVRGDDGVVAPAADGDERRDALAVDSEVGLERLGRTGAVLDGPPVAVALPHVGLHVGRASVGRYEDYLDAVDILHRKVRVLLIDYNLAMNQQDNASLAGSLEANGFLQNHGKAQDIKHFFALMFRLSSSCCFLSSLTLPKA